MPQAQATLLLAELDQYHVKLIPMMLEMLRPRLAWTWHAMAGGDGDADVVMADIASPQGRWIVTERVGAGLGTRTIALGEGKADGGVHGLCKPLRLHALLTALSGIEADDVPIGTASLEPTRYRLLAWPELDPRATGSDRLRILALLDRCPQTAAEVARRLELSPGNVQAEIAALLGAGVLAPVSAASYPRERPVPVPPPVAGRGLVALLRQRFGL